jgi:hypothetical protein
MQGNPGDPDRTWCVAARRVDVAAIGYTNGMRSVRRRVLVAIGWAAWKLGRRYARRRMRKAFELLG